MKKSNNFIAIIIIITSILWSLSDTSPSNNDIEKLKKETLFSIDNALHHLKNISQKPHFTGSSEHKEVQQYIVNELARIGLKPTIKRQVAYNKKWKAATTTENIVTKIKGRSKKNALLLLTHYDSHPHSSKGASDAGSGVVTILEGIRAFLSKNKEFNNDIIIVFTDAEELGLLGAQSFVDNHPWASQIKLILNFEARGSGGSSIMLMETNGKNKKLFEEFRKANVNFPISNSLLYSIYKILPNDTDLTVFREHKDINGFNFAFIGDHFDYHTEQDSYERLDRKSLIHQADYLMNSLNYFANSDISNLNSDEDLIFVNFPFIKMISYSYKWIFPLLLFSIFLFAIAYFLGVRKQIISIHNSVFGLVPFLISLLASSGISFLLWQLLLFIHPGYTDMLHGFTYNGYIYMCAFTALTLWVLYKVYSYFTYIKPTDLFIAPITFGILLNVLVTSYLPGATFLIIPVLIAIIILLISLFLKIKQQPLIYATLSIPSIYILAPLIKLFPIGLGLKTLFISSIFITFLFGWLIPILLREDYKSRWQIVAGLSTFILFIISFINSGFDVNNKKPNSLVFIENSNTKTSYWATYNNTLDTYTKQIFNKNYIKGNIPESSGKSKYNTPFKYYKPEKYQNIANSKVSILIDTIFEKTREISLLITPQRKINKYEIHTSTPFEIEGICINGVSHDYKTPLKINEGVVFTYQMTPFENDISLLLKIPKNTKPSLTLNEVSYDLLKTSLFNLSPRNENMMPMPFVNNDAIITSQKLEL